jgi:hypothetical protein
MDEPKSRTTITIPTTLLKATRYYAEREHIRLGDAFTRFIRIGMSQIIKQRLDKERRLQWHKRIKVRRPPRPISPS